MKILINVFKQGVLTLQALQLLHYVVWILDLNLFAQVVLDPYNELQETDETDASNMFVFAALEAINCPGKIYLLLMKSFAKYYLSR